MPDTGAPWNIPYVAGTDLVADWPTDSQTLAEAIADGLDAAGGLVAVKHALFTGTQSASLAAGAGTAVTDLSITHTLADASNKLIISAYLGSVANNDGRANTGLRVMDGATPIGVGDAAGSRTRVGAGGWNDDADGGNNVASASRSVTFVYEPGDTASHTYTVEAVNIDITANVVYVNIRQDDAGAGVGSQQRASSGLVIQEVAV